MSVIVLIMILGASDEHEYDLSFTNPREYLPLNYLPKRITWAASQEQ